MLRRVSQQLWPGVGGLLNRGALASTSAVATASSTGLARAFSGFALTATSQKHEHVYNPSSSHVPTETKGPLTVKYPFPIEYYKDREILVHNIAKQPVGVQSLNGQVFNVPVRVDILHRVVRYLRAKWQQGTHKAKTRSEVSGGGRKPWRQKKTGKARQGSIRSPIWVGGGSVFGPRPRSHAHHLYYKVRQLGMKCALSAKYNEERLLVVDSLVPRTSKTTDVIAMARVLLRGMHAKTVLLVDSGETAVDGGEPLRRGAGSSDWLHVMSVDQLTVYHILKYNALVLTKPAAQKLQEQLTGAPKGVSEAKHQWWLQQQEGFREAAKEIYAAMGK